MDHSKLERIFKETRDNRVRFLNNDDMKEIISFMEKPENIPHGYASFLELFLDSNKNGLSYGFDTDLFNELSKIKNQWTKKALEKVFTEYTGINTDFIIKHLPHMIKSGRNFKEIQSLIEAQEEGYQWKWQSIKKDSLESLLSGGVSHRVNKDEILFLLKDISIDYLNPAFEFLQKQNHLNPALKEIIENNADIQLSILSHKTNLEIRDFTFNCLQNNKETKKGSLVEAFKLYFRNKVEDIEFLEFLYDKGVKLSNKNKYDYSLYECVDIYDSKKNIEFLMGKGESFNRKNSTMMEVAHRMEYDNKRKAEKEIESDIIDNLKLLFTVNNKKVFDPQKWLEDLKKSNYRALDKFINIVKNHSDKLKDDLKAIGFFDDVKIISHLNKQPNAPKDWKVTDDSFKEDLNGASFKSWLKTEKDDKVFTNELYPMEEWLDYVDDFEILLMISYKEPEVLNAWLENNKQYYKDNQRLLYAFIQNYNKEWAGSKLLSDKIIPILDLIEDIDYKYMGNKYALLFKIIDFDNDSKDDLNKTLQYLKSRNFDFLKKRSDGDYWLNYYINKALSQNYLNGDYVLDAASLISIVKNIEAPDIFYQKILDGITKEAAWQNGFVFRDYSQLMNEILNHKELDISTQIIRSFVNPDSFEIQKEDNYKTFTTVIDYHKNKEISQVKANALWESAAKINAEVLFVKLVEEKIKLPTKSAISKITSRNNTTEHFLKKALLATQHKEVKKEQAYDDLSL